MRVDMICPTSVICVSVRVKSWMGWTASGDRSINPKAKTVVLKHKKTIYTRQPETVLLLVPAYPRMDSTSAVYTNRSIS